jgi:hypothetical protein
MGRPVVVRPDLSMPSSSSEKPKLCIHCGADVTHQERYKNRSGQYACPQCQRKRERRWFGLRALRHRLREWRTWASYTVAVAVGAILVAAILLYILRYVNNSISG